MQLMHRRRSVLVCVAVVGGAVAAALIGLPHHVAAQQDDAKIVGNLDEQYQAAVKINDTATMDRILADNYTLVTGHGTVQNKADLLEEARSGRMHYEHQEDTDRTVRLYGNAAVVTAFLWEKGSDGKRSFDYKLWFSDVYMKTPGGWRYVFAQSSLPLVTAP